MISLRSELSGELHFEGRTLSFDKGIGYIEKDWGRSFPKAHIWIQASRFQDSDASLSVAIAKMKVAGFSLTGFGAILILAGKQHLFTSYKLSKLDINSGKEEVALKFSGNTHQLLVKASASDWAKLKSPNGHGMDGMVRESLNAHLSIALFRNQKLIYEDIAINAGLEIEGKWE